VTGTRAFGGSLLLLADALFLGALLFIHAATRGATAPWPDIGEAPPFALPLLAAAAGVLTAAVAWLDAPPWAPLLPLAAAVALLAQALRATALSGAAIASGRYGTLVFALSAVWVAHLAGAAALLALRARRGARVTPGVRRFLALQSLFGLALATMVFRP
jgi:hypothetical protein